MKILKSDKGILSILTGKTDMGKSTISVYDCQEKIREGESILFFSYEYCQSIIYNKLVTHFGLKFNELFNLNVVESSFMSLKDVIETIKKKKPDTVYIDYLDLLRKYTYEVSDKDTVNKVLEDQKEIIKELSKVAHDLDISIILLSQENKEATFEDTVQKLNTITETVNPKYPAVKMFIGRDDIFSPMINCNDISHVVLVDGYNLKHFASINIKEVYKD